MKLSLRLARVSGIDIRVHATFVLVLVFGAVQFGQLHGSSGAWFGAFFMCCLFACVALHELGHSLVAQQLGVRVREIVLLPIGGVARLSGDPKTPLHELLIAIAGPLVNVVLAALGLGVALVAFGWRSCGSRRPAWARTRRPDMRRSRRRCTPSSRSSANPA
jgi:Zn-dependent protease